MIWYLEQHDEPFFCLFASASGCVLGLNAVAVVGSRVVIDGELF